MSGAPLRICCVCASNMNRSMAAHAALALQGYSVRSYGTGEHVKLPGLSASQPAVFDFGVAYEDMSARLSRVSEESYKANGVLAMLSRNAKVKRAPEPWAAAAKERFDVVVAFEARVFEVVVSDFVCARSPAVFQPAVVLNVEVRDTHADAAEGARVVVELVELLAASDDLEADLGDILRKVEEKEHTSICCVPIFF